MTEKQDGSATVFGPKAGESTNSASVPEERRSDLMLSEPGFATQVPVAFTVANYLLVMPSGHPLLQLLNPASPSHQPYREAGLIRLVQALAQLGRCGTAIDVGANIGDSCAIVHRLSGLSILCIEASDFFFPYLEDNIRRHFAARATARCAFVLGVPGSAPTGLYHMGGSARAVVGASSESSAALPITELLAQVSDIAMLKIDVDGMDLALVAAALDTVPRYPIYFELELMGETLETNRGTAAQARDLFAKAAAAGYPTAWLWDDSGRFYGCLATDDVGALANALNYMAHFRSRPLWGFDVCLVHWDDSALAAELERALTVNAVLPLPLGE